MLRPLGTPIKCHEEVLSLQPMNPALIQEFQLLVNRKTPKNMQLLDKKSYYVYRKYDVLSRVECFWSCSCSLKKMKFLTRGGIICISRSSPWHFYFKRGHSLDELTEHDNSADIMVDIMYVCTAAFSVHNMY